MSVPPELMKLLSGGGGAPGGGAPGAAPGGAAPAAAAPGASAGMNPGGQPPAAAPMSKPQEKKGLKVAAQTNVHIAVNMLEEALPAYGSESEEGAKILKALDILAKLVAKRDSSDLVPAELLQMFRRLPQMGGGTDVQKAIMQQMQKPQPAPQAA